MALSHSPRIITNGLVLCLDAANRKSYPTTGTTWTDLSGRGNNGTLVNGVGYVGTNGGSLSFDGVNDYVNIPSGIPQRTDNFSNEIWVYPTNLTGGANGYSTLLKLNATRDFYFTLRNNGAIHCEIRNIANSGYDNFDTATSVIAINNWYQIVQVFSLTTQNISFYVNGVLRLSSATPAYPSFYLANSMQIAQQGTNVSDTYARRLTGSVSNVKLYNRALSAAEVKQNYDAFKGRYGLT
jgi:hypothetical protein